ncbi:MAG TPA: HAMP domain-containing sensor histidine kinase, partial [Nitrososphaeraceae archaeon]|nr:HAMP domain-containing sensor histidine kinase [Nitrososphaeraceae archaeon]
LHLAKIESQTLKLNKEQFCLRKAVLLVVQDLINQSSRYNGKKANVHLVDGNWERGADRGYDIIVEADKQRIIQVISNILSNAIRFAKEGDVSIGIERKVRIVEADGGKNNDNDNNSKEVIVSVKDTGIGIDPDVFPRLFSKFAVTFCRGGTGLGLFISKSIVEAHGGKIWAENNTDGKGATFSFSLPINY